MKKRIFMIAALVSGAMAVSGCTTNPYTGGAEKQVKQGSVQDLVLWWAPALAHCHRQNMTEAKAR
ncbi:Inner membrane lipoprotein YiaD precursor [Kluyvera cryocrescens]|uniref:Inner membrane lipoprotein YiaD n=1 Tax=Kluyvera cryocrescens TaxID=580 RepID=A0A485AZD3_KLUCR|nr:Inner membrane lipoprotein YiaD precursor [Kluyvera cryocrescens]